MKLLDRAFWTAHSRTWDDALGDPRVVDHIDELADWLASAAPAGATVVDVGCGTGNHSRALAARGMRAVGVDGSPGMLGRARTKVHRLIRADLAVMPVRGSSVDAVLSVYSAQFFDLTAYLRETRRVVRPGGIILIELPKRTGVLRRERELPVRARAFQAVKEVAAAVGSRVGRVHAHSPEELSAALASAAFERQEERTTDFSFVVLARAT